MARKWQHMLDMSAPHTAARWGISALVMITYAIRIYLINGWYIITYGLGIYVLNLLIGFLSPRDDMALNDDPVLPKSQSEEYRPFNRRLPEFHFWKSACRAVLCSMVATFFPFLDIPVFWPILLLYFIVLFVLTMKRQIRHMIKFRYLPFSWGKKTYKGADTVTKKKHSNLPKLDRPPKVRSYPG